VKVARLARLAPIALAIGCSRKAQEAPVSPRPDAAVSAPTPSSAPASIDAIAHLEDCALGHRGVLVDLGGATARAEVATRSDRGRVESIEREGATWSRILARTMTITFAATDAAVAPGADPETPPVVEARVRGGVARSITVFLNGKPAGVWPLVKGETRVVSAKLTWAGTPNGAQLVSGTNELLLKLNSGAVKGGASPDEQAEIDWIHVGPPDPDGAYGAPTREDALTSVTVGGVPRRALSLRAPGFARCAGFLPSGGKVLVSLGLAGGGEGDAEVRLLRDRASPVVLQAVHLGPSDASAWRSIAVPIGDLGGAARDAKAGGGGTLGAIELVATKAAKGTRVVFGEPRVVRASAPPAEPPRTPAARGVVLVVMGDLSPRLLELYGGKIALPELAALAKSGATFETNRATSSVPSAAFASMLTGVSPRASGVSDEDAALPPDVTTLADALRQAGVASAMFTANPTTGSAFGFARGWSTFLEKSPLEDGATSVFDEAVRWIDAHKEERFFAVIHARGGHPPWDATNDELKALAPADYAGGIDPKHAAELLAKARKAPPQIRLTDADRARAWALYALALRAHDAGLGRVIAAVKAADRDASTLYIVTGDATMDEAAHVPSADEDSLDEAALAVPLVVRAPSAPPAARVTLPTTSTDIATSILGAFELPPPAAFQGTDLWQTAGGRADPRGRPLVAMVGGRFAVRWSSFVLTGVRQLVPIADASELRETKLCDLTLEPGCVSDVRGAFPIALEALHRVAFDPLVAADHARSPAIIDAKTAATLKGWGR